MALIFTQSYSIPGSRNPFDSARLPVLTTFTLCHHALLNVEPEMQNTTQYVQAHLFRKVF